MTRDGIASNNYWLLEGLWQQLFRNVVLDADLATRGRVIKVRASGESIEFLKLVISLITSDGRRGWKWTMDHIQRSFILRRGFFFITLGSQRAQLMTRDGIAKQQFLANGAVFIKGIKICRAPWTTKLYTFRND